MARHPSSTILLATSVLGFGAAPLATRHAVTPPDVKAILKKAADNLTKARAFTFTLTAAPVTPGSRLAAVTSGDGTVIAPDRLVFRGTMQTTPALGMPFVSAMCAADQYMEFGDGTFQKMDGAPNVYRLLFTRDTGLVTGVLTGLEKVSVATAAVLDKQPVWKITGAAPAALLAALPGHATNAAAAKSSISVDVWIGQKDSQLHQMTVTGPLFNGDRDATSRTLTFSQFDEPLTLTVPRGQLPCNAKP